jgi:hypothetical protein
MIHRQPRDEDHPYFRALKAPFEDKRLSWGARGLLAYLLTKPDNWEVMFNDLLNQAPDQRTALRSVIKELEKYGYLRRRRIQGEKGKFVWVTDVYEAPLPPDEEQRDSDNPSVGFPSVENQPMDEPSVGFPPVENPSTENLPIQEQMNLVTNEFSSGDAFASPLPKKAGKPKAPRVGKSENQEKASRKASASPHAEHPAVSAYRAFHNRFPTKKQMEAIAEQVTNAERWGEIVKAWELRGYSPRNIEGMLDWYHNGIPGAPNGNNNGHPSDTTGATVGGMRVLNRR